MHTVSTLCATSTVGIAACGYALALPHCDANDRSGNRPGPSSTTPPLLIEDPTEEQPLCGNPNHAHHPLQAPISTFMTTPVSRPSTSHRWLRRLSESFSLSPTSSSLNSTQSSITSSTSSEARSVSVATSHSSSRPPTRNGKLVKRCPSQRLSRSNSPIPPRLSRPSTGTAVNQPQTCEQINLSPFHVSRSSTSGPDLNSYCPYNPEAVNVWRPFFSAKRQKPLRNSSGSKLAKTSGIRRIVPDFFRRRFGPALVIAPVVTPDPPEQGFDSDIDPSNLCVETASLGERPRPVTHHMGETAHQRPTRQRSSTSATTPLSSSTKRDFRRSFSLSNFLGVTNSKHTSNTSEPVEENTNGYVGICSMGVGFSRGYPADERFASYPYRGNRPATSAAHHTFPRAQLPPIQSLSRLNLNSEPLLASSPSPSPSLSNGDLPRSETLVEDSTPTPDSSPTDPRPHRLSNMSASERASTLVGSDSENEYGSDTFFDSLRTRTSEMSPIRVDRIFSMDRNSPDSDNRLPLFNLELRSETCRTPTSGYNIHTASPNSNRTAQPEVAKITIDDDDNESDWNTPVKSTDRNGHGIYGDGGLRPCSELLSASCMNLSIHSNTSSTSFGTAPEGYSVDGSSTTNSVLDWNDTISVQTSHSNAYWSTSGHGNENMISPSRVPRKTPSYHFRSQSVPVVNTLRGRTPLPSENWDDDFLDEQEGEVGMHKSEMIIPRAIEERQASIIGHLGCVREFALLVEDLKRLREVAFAQNMRYKADHDLWDEAEGIIALASLEDDEEDAPFKRDRLHRQNTWSSVRRRGMGLEKGAYTVSNRQSSVLCPDDDIFGGHDGNVPIMPHYKNGLHTSPAPSSSSLVSRKIVDTNDSIEVAKTMMEKMRQRSDHHVVSRDVEREDRKVHFDTDMLRELVVRTARLKQKLTRSVEGYPPLSERGLRLKIRSIDATTDDKFDFDLSPIRSSRDENIGVLERVGSNGLEFTPVIGVA